MHKILSFILFLFHFSVQLQAQNWESLPGPGGGMVRQFAVEGNDLYVLTTGGVYLSTNQGATWRLIKGTRELSYYAKQLQVQSHILYILLGNKLYRGNDQGIAWKNVLESGKDLMEGDNILGMFVSGNVLTVFGNYSIYYADNQGNSWSKAQTPPAYFMQSFSAATSILSDLFVNYESWILVSRDHGRSWQNLFVTAYYLGDVEAVNTRLYSFYKGYPRLIRSFDGGINWDVLESDSIKIDPYYRFFKQRLTGVGDTLYLWTVFSCFHGGVNIFRSTDEGEHWRKMACEGINRNVTNDIKAVQGQILVGGFEGLDRSTDGGNTFHYMPAEGMNATCVSRIFQTANGRWWAQTYQGIFSSDDNGSTWDFRLEGKAESSCDAEGQIFTTEKRMFTTDMFMYMLRLRMSEDGGNTWLEVPGGNSWSPTFFTTKNAVWKNSEDHLYRMNDGENAFTEVSIPIKKYYHISAFDTTLLLYDNNSHYYSKDNGDTWQAFLSEPNVPHNPGFVDNEAYYISKRSAKGGIYRYNFATSQWSDFYPQIGNDTLKKTDAFSMLFSAHGLRFYIVNGKGVYYAEEKNEEKLAPLQPGNQFPNVIALAINNSGNELWAGTWGQGIYRLPIQWQNNSEKPQFSLYPNPSFGRLNLSSNIFLTEKPRLKVFDSSGRAVYDEVLAPGQNWQWHFELPSGLYFLQVITEEGSCVLKWVVSR